MTTTLRDALARFPLGRLQDLMTLWRGVSATGATMEDVAAYVVARARAVRHSTRVRTESMHRPCTMAGCGGTQWLLPLNDKPLHYTGAILPDGSRDFSRPGPEVAVWYCPKCKETFDAPGPLRKIIADTARSKGIVGKGSVE